MIFSVVIVLEILLSYLVKTFWGLSNITQFLLVCINTVIFLFLMNKNQKMTKRQKIILILALLTRIGLLLVDEFIHRIPFNSGDADRFDEMATQIANDMGLLKSEEYLYGGMYSKLLGILYYAMGNARFFAQSINVFLGMGTIYLLFYLLNTRKFKMQKVELFLEILIAFFPFTILFSICLLRESIMIFLIIFSLKTCIDYIESKKVYPILISFVSVILATTFHSGNIFIIVGYVLIFSFYEQEEKKFGASFKNIMKCFVVTCIIIAINMMFSNVLANKFTRQIKNNNKIENQVDTAHGSITQTTHEMKQTQKQSKFQMILKNNPITKAIETTARGDSAYIGGRTVNNFAQFVLYSMEKVFYFMFSPLPWDWRGLTDALVFLMDSMLYIIFLIDTLFHIRKQNKTNGLILLFLVFGIALSIALYSIGTFNAGTALRHRHKFLYYIIILNVLTHTKKESEEMNA